MKVVLHHRAEFAALLDQYEPSETTKQLVATSPLVILLGVSGSGRNTIIDKLVDTGRYHYIISDTTRPPKRRDGKLEQDGVTYNFRSEEAVIDDLKQGAYIEAELIHDQQVSGISVHEFSKAKASGKTPINEVDIGGTDALYAIKPDTLFLFVIPPSFDEWMRRLRAREMMSDDELSNRMKTAVRIFRTVLSSDRFVFVVNDDLDEVVATVDDYVRGVEHHRHNTAARILAEQLLYDTLRQYPELSV